MAHLAYLSVIQRLKMIKNMHFGAAADIYDQDEIQKACNVNQFITV